MSLRHTRSCLTGALRLILLPHTQAMDLVWDGIVPPRLLAQAEQHGLAPRAKPLPLDLAQRLPALTALNLSDNNLVQVPPFLLKMTGLEVLDLSGAVRWRSGAVGWAGSGWQGS